METFLSVIAGGVITWLVAWIYYLRASKGLVKEADRLRKAIDLLIRGMEQEGWITGVKRDDSGSVVSWTQKVGVASIESGESFGRPEVCEKDKAE